MRNSQLIMKRDSFPKELDLLLAYLKLEQDELSHGRQQELAIDMDWDRFIQLVRHHRVSAIIYNRLKNANHPWIPTNVLEALRNEYNNNVFRMLHLSGEMESICKLLAENHIHALLLKGPALAFDLYGDISLRTSKDLDILVDIHKLDEVNKLLLEQGYETEDIIQTLLNSWKWRKQHVAYFHPRKRIFLELHWRLNPGPAKEPSFNELWERKKLNALTSYPVYGLGEADLFCFLVSHGARHGWFRLRWLVDIDILTRRQIDWTSVSLFLKKYQLTMIGGQALKLASNLLGTPLNNEMETMANRSRAGLLAQLALLFINEKYDLHSNPPETIASNLKRYLFAVKSKRQKLLYILNKFYPYPIDAQTLPLPKSIHYLYFPLRPFLWAWRKAKDVLT
ncbi:nucleotidyltransferase domain-containing protein [Cohnella lupini]|uniref:Putative nucleotidyltransferase-like protein n=1 Tax=Cohnella lupini TaxID=1294267 RepID=A0A3D9IPN0_9BACL|nr:nucleotidyltransferase family protein [Cohnella lupini]RED63036.1 putative nucleotidyltransferase-like protein [Cohnella lupini]